MSDLQKPPGQFDLRDAAPTDVGAIVKRGLRYGVGFLAIFMVWGLFVPLSSAVIGPGTITSDGQNKVLQHISGGRVTEIRVEDGAALTQGETVMVLDPAINRAELFELKARRDTLHAAEARLRSLAQFDHEKNAGDGTNLLAATITGSALRGSDGTTAEPAAFSGQPTDVFQAQKLELQFGSASESAEYKALLHQVGRLKKERKSLRARVQNLLGSLEVTRTELANLRSLVDQGYLPRTKLWQAIREEKSLANEVNEAHASIQGIDEQIGEAENRVLAFVANRKREATKELTQVLGDLAQIREKISAAEQALAHTEIKAPVDGTLVQFSAQTVGGVVRAGSVIGQIVPDGAALVVEGRVLPKDIASVAPGQRARAVVTALNRRRFDPLETTITYVSADSIEDPKTGTSYFLVRAAISNIPRGEDGRRLIRPGMDADLYIQAGARPFLFYLLQPLTDSFAKAFSET